MNRISTLSDIKEAAETQPWPDCMAEKTVFERVTNTAAKNANRPALSFQIKSGPKDPAETLSWADLHNCNEAVLTFLGASTVGIVNPINPTLHPDQIASILRETGAKVLVTLAPFPKAEVAEIAAQAVARAPNVETVLEVDLRRTNLTGFAPISTPAEPPGCPK